MTTEYAEVEVEITRELAMRSERWACSSCPVARAIDEYLVPGAKAHVTQTIVVIYTTDSAVSFELAKDAQAFIDRYDHELPIDFPVKLKLALPKQVLKEAA